MKNLSSENLRYLLWRSKIKREDWSVQLSAWAKCHKSRAEEILNGAPLETIEQQEIAKNTDVSEEAIQTERFLNDKVDVLWENIKFLTEKDYTGEKLVAIARAIGVSQVTISRWRSRNQRPEDAQIAKLCLYFNLPAKTDLKTDSIFLSLYPIGALDRKNWLKQQIDQLDPEILDEIFPALRRLLK
jgi:transcriptional regulator with XRE-family HTH domain